MMRNSLAAICFRGSFDLLLPFVQMHRLLAVLFCAPGISPVAMLPGLDT